MTLQTIHFLIGLIGAKAEIEAVSPTQGSRLAYATDTDELGTFDGANWHWVAMKEGYTTGISEATFSQGSGAAVNDNSTFDGFTIGQIVQALRDAGLLA